MKKPKLIPPRIGTVILKFLIRSRNFEVAIGDIIEIYYRTANERGRFKAWLWFWFQIIMSLPGFVNNSLYWSCIMFRNYVKVAYRNLSRKSIYSFINISGLSFGLASCLLIMIYVSNELSYDRFFAKGESIYRVLNSRTTDSNERVSAYSPVPMGLELKKNYPEILEVVRFWRAFEPVVGYNDKYFQEYNFYFVDASVFKVFSFGLIVGEPETALLDPNSIIITQATAVKYFGTENPLGKILTLDGYPAEGTVNLTVKGIIRDLPNNTHFQFDFLASILGVKTEIENWGSFKPIWTYALLSENVQPDILENKFPEFVSKYLMPNWFENVQIALRLEPLYRIHLKSEFKNGFKPGSDSTYVYMVALIGLFIIMLSGINYMILATARSQSRVKEIGMRKVLGSNRLNIALQFLGEAFLFSLVSMVVAIIIAMILLPVFNDVTGKEITLSYFFDPVIILLMIGATLCVGALSGIYPALYLSRLKPIDGINNKFIKSGSEVRIRQALVIFQFTITSLLIIGTLLIYKQLDYMRNKNLGFAKENIVVLPSTDKTDIFFRQIRNSPGVINATLSQRVPVNFRNSDRRPVSISGILDPIQVESYIVDEQFIPTYGIKIIAGRNFSQEYSDGKNAFIVNSSAVKSFGWQSPEESLGKEIDWGIGQKSGQVIGVIEDFHLETLHRKIEPLVIQMLPEEYWWRTFISVRIRPEKTAETLAMLQKRWTEHTPDGAYSYFFVDRNYEQLYKKEVKFGQLFIFLTVITALIACLGLFGLCSFVVEQRTKEIGIRKVLGASVSRIMSLILPEFAVLVTISVLLSWLFSYFLMNRWLETFAYKTDLGWILFLVTGISALTIAFLAVVFQTAKAGFANPVDSLKYE